MGGSLAWLHLSDWHQRGPDFERRAVRDALLADLQQRAEIDSGLEQIDFVVFSGDLAFSGHPAEYETAAKEFLEPVLQAVGVTRERLFVVPGNHDLSRASLRLLGRWLDAFPNLQHINAALIDPDQRRTLLSPMEGYANFVRAFHGTAAVAEPAYGFLSPFEVRGILIALVGMNTAWLSGQRIEDDVVNDFGVLALGEPQFHQPMQDANFLRADVRIGVLHHPFYWLGERFERSRIEQTLTRGFHFLLRGHEHEPRVAIPNGTDGTCAIISAGAAYDRRDQPMNGYNFVHLDLDKGRGTAFLRRYDINRGFLKDTSTTGDATPGYHRFRLPRKVARASNRTPLRRPAKSFAVERVRDHRSLDVIAAVELYAARIPTTEQVTASDFIRWLREDEERRQMGYRSRDFMFVAKQRDEVCGFALLHSNAERRLAFVAYLVAMPGLKGEDRTISATLLEEVAKLFEPDGELADHSGILLDVEDPRTAASPEQAREQLARLRLFWTLAERESFLLRALDFPYRQPLLHLPQPGDRGRELPLLLMFAQLHGKPMERFFSRDRVLEFLDFMYGFLYPEGFSPLEEENIEYRRYVDEIHAAVSELVPEKVPVVDFGEIQGWRGYRAEGGKP
ncbi:MAG TPA: metallophosphoesterase [Thermoanaerobaculia bacterium]|jgi:predicted phosphodiesterase|nr:metallophosphoesterase [Thermoanaerobaculia bacterium]